MSESEKKYGTDALEKVVDFGAETFFAVKAAKSDGKIDVADAPLLLKPVMALFPMIAVIPTVPKQFGDLDESEKAHLVEYVKAKKLVDDSKVALFVERSFKL